jgi:hypothetical protein
VHGYVFELTTGKLRSPRGLCGDQRPFVIEDDGEGTLTIWDPFEVVVVP